MAGRAPLAVVDRERCIGSGMCVDYAPGTFTQDEQAKAVVLAEADDPADVVGIAVESCPTGALRLAHGAGLAQNTGLAQDGTGA